MKLDNINNIQKKITKREIVNLWFLTISLKIRNYFFTGIIVLIPIGFTLYLSKFLINLTAKLVPQGLNPNTYLPYSIPGIEIILSIIFITIVALPLFYAYKSSQTGGMEEYVSGPKLELAKFTLGNMGGATVLCKSKRIE